VRFSNRLQIIGPVWHGDTGVYEFARTFGR